MQGKTKNILYLGTDPSHFPLEGNIHHYPVIDTVARSPRDSFIQDCFQNLSSFTHIIFTSKNAVRIFFELKQYFPIPLAPPPQCLSIGSVTTQALLKHGIKPILQADPENQEGMIELLKEKNWTEASILYPRSSLARPLLANFLRDEGITHQVLDLYDTRMQKLLPIPDLQNIDTIVFTSPSTVDAFFQIFPDLPEDKEVIVIGAVTEKALLSVEPRIEYKKYF